MKRLFPLVAFLLVAACGNSTVGSPCTVSSDCDVGQQCNTSAPGGLCTHGCSFAGATLRECPSGSVCTTIGTNNQLCAAICTESTSCRDQYECAASTGSSLKSCKPKS